MVTKLVKDIIGAVFMSLGVLFALGMAAVGCVSVLEEDTGCELTMVPKEDKNSKK